MTKFNNLQNNFIAGELSPKFATRADTELYYRGAEELRNMIVYPQGGVARRVGTQFISSSMSAATACRLIPYVASNTVKQILILQAGSSTMYYYDVDAGTTTSSSIGGSDSYSADELLELQYVQVGELLFVVQKDSSPKYWAGGGPLSPIFNILTSAAGLTTNTSTLLSNTPFQDVNLTTTTITPSAVSGTITLTASASLFVAAMAGDDVTPGDADYPTIFKLNSGYAVVTAFTSSTQVTAVVYGPNLSGTGATAAWQESAWSTYRGFPRTVAAFEQRLYMGGSKTFPDQVWASQIGDLVEFNNTIGTAESDAFTFTIASERIDQIQWMSPGAVLNIGTLNKEFIAKGASNTATLSTGNISFETRTDKGSAFVKAERVNNAPVFVGRNNTKIHEFVFNFDEDNYRSTDITYYSDHVAFMQRDRLASFSNPKIVQLAHQPDDYSILWMIDNNGGLIGCTRDREFGVAAFHTHVLGGNFGGDDVKVESIAVVPNADNTHDDLYLIAVRTINGSTVRYLERMNKEFTRTDLYNASTSVIDKPIYLDCAKFQQLGAPGTSFNGFAHLAGATVQVIADGLYIGEKTVSGAGVITLSSNATEVIAGYSYRSLMKTLPIVAGSRFGLGQGVNKRTNTVIVNFLRTVGAQIGKDEDNLDRILFRTADLSVEDPIPLYTGEKRISFDLGYDTTNQLVIVQDDPMPFAIRYISFEGMSYD